jgi:N-acyl-D-aspartate/D-glutamate deacylase
MAMLYHAMSFPGLAVASDAMWFASTGDIDLDEVETTWPLPSAVVAHPRTAGTFSRAIRMGIDTGIWSIDEAIARCSLTPARILEQTAPAMKHKGRIQLGMDADIAIFDPNAICDKATYDQLIPSVGFEWVLVAGVPVVHDSVLIESALPGKPITNQFV